MHQGSSDPVPSAAPLFGGEENDVLDPKRLAQEVEMAAASIGSVLDSHDDKGAVPLNHGIATLLYGFWVKDGRDSRYTTNIQTFTDLAGVISDYHQQGFAPIDLMGSGRLFEPWTVVVAPRPPAYYWMSTGNPQEFLNKDMELLRAGFRIVSFNRRHGQFNVTWHGGRTGTQWVRWGMSYFELLAWNTRYLSQNLRITAIDRYGEGGNQYAAVWQPGDGEQIIEAPGGMNTYFGQPARLNVYRYVREGLFVRAMGHNGYPVAVFRPNAHREPPSWYASSPGPFRESDVVMRARGFRLDQLSHAPWQFG